MYCFKCGTVLSENAKFCSKCGTAVLNNVSTENRNPYATASSPELTPNATAPCVSHIVADINTSAKSSKPNPFAFISAGIMAVMLVLYFCPWFFLDGTMSDVFGYYIDRLPLVYPDDTAVILFLIFSLIGMGMLILGIVMAFIKKRRVPLAFALIASVSVQISLVFFCFTKEAWTIGVSAVPVVLFLMTYINIAFAIPAKIR
ncbi:MAG: zinc ribbon domain-containing protein [Clostridia bacterium]|nr:zinc ribbon domain-containing protein [Clostridia bacterium]